MKDRALHWDECITPEREYEYVVDYYGLRLEDESREICLACDLPLKPNGDCQENSPDCGLRLNGFKPPKSKNPVKKSKVQYAQSINGKEA